MAESQLGMGPGYGLRFGRRFLLCGHQVGFTIDNGLRSGTLPGPDVACRRVKTAEVNGIVIVGRRERDRRREAGRRRAGKSNLRVAGIVQYVVIAIPLADPDVGGKRIGGGDRSVVRFFGIDRKRLRGDTDLHTVCRRGFRRLFRTACRRGEDHYGYQNLFHIFSFFY